MHGSRSYIPSSQRSTPNPTSPKSRPHHPGPFYTGIAASGDPLSRTKRRAQIAGQVEEQINRQADPNYKTVVPAPHAPPSILELEGELSWDPIRSSKYVPRDFIDQETAKRAKGWERGKREDGWFQREYRYDYDDIPIFNFRYKTPNNSKVSDHSRYWRSRDWISGPTETQENVSKLKGAENDPSLVAAMKRATEPLSQDERFLQTSLPALDTLWKGVKVLGRGGQGVASLWEYMGPGTHIWGRRIVIKQSLEYPLDEEREMMLELDDGSEQAKNHALKLLYPVTPVTVDRNQTGQIYRIILEYCEGGDLNSWLIKQKKTQKYFSEETLWRFFDCFAKGLNLMDHGNETPERNADSRNPICHNDLKPQNILVGSVDDEHDFIPLTKIADFGLASCIDPIKYEEHWRRIGTEGFYPPEQFSARWAYRDASRCGHINAYGTHTNVWQIGVVIYMLATLKGPPRPKGFRCSLIGRKFTYGYKLHRRTNYSNCLKSLIWRCLCDKPRDRPSLMVLHIEIASSLKAISIVPIARRSKRQLEPPEPPPPREPFEGPPPQKGFEIPMKGIYRGARQTDEGTPTGIADPSATGTRAAPFIVPGTTKILKNRPFNFSIVPKHLPEGKQEPIWFRAYPDSTVRELKRVIREDAGLNLVDNKQFIYIRLVDQPHLLLENMARMLSLYGVAQGLRLELWTDKEAHDAAEPDEDDFSVL